MRLIIRHFPSVFLLLNGLIYLFLAYLFLTDAAGWFIRLGVSPSEEVGLTELRAMYLGLMFAIGIFMTITYLKIMKNCPIATLLITKIATQ